jgi:hypothetical protein
MPSNPYQKYINEYFQRLLELRHRAYRINTVLRDAKKDFEYVKEDEILSASALIISDWSGSDLNPFARNYHTGVFSRTRGRDYKQEIDHILSFQCCSSFVQGYEALEKLLKDFVYVKSQKDNKFYEKVQAKHDRVVSRATLRGGDVHFSLSKLACGSSYRDLYRVNLKILWSLIADVRHAITHSSSLIKYSKLTSSREKLGLFKELFYCSKIGKEYVLIEIDYKNLDSLIKVLAEIGFQFFKLTSQEDNLDWDILRK